MLKFLKILWFLQKPLQHLQQKYLCAHCSVAMPRQTDTKTKEKNAPAKEEKKKDDDS